MDRPADRTESGRTGRIALVGTYPPRRCGIATFTRDLAASIGAADARVKPMAVAVTDSGGPYEYPDEVVYEIRQAAKGDYARAAELINYQDVRWVSLQHEYGIFGGDDGAYILDLLSALRVPTVVTLHTVLDNPSDSQRTIVQRMAKAARLVVMSKVASDLLARRYGLRDVAVHIIPHGIPDLAPRDQNELKARFGLRGQRMMLTFGLLGPNKGIETVIRALPAILAACPDIVYFVVGATHPAVIRHSGEAYRTTLEREAERLGVRDHVVFRDQYVTTGELCDYLQATDVFVQPVPQRGAGDERRALVRDGSRRRGGLDTVLAREGAAGGRPRPPRPVRGHLHARQDDRLPPGVTGRAQPGQEPRVPTPPRASSLPELRLDHLVRLTDDTGIIQHATFSVPARESGYCVDDNARALVVALHADRLAGSPATARLVSTYLGFLHLAQTGDGRFRNLMSYNRSFAGDSASEDCTGRALWALGTAAHLAGDEGQRMLARQMFERGLPFAAELGPRGTALTMLGLESFLTAHAEVTPAAALLQGLARRLCQQYRDRATPEWCWFEPTLTYDNALLPLALWRAQLIEADPDGAAVARQSLAFLEQHCFRDGRLVLIGNDGWHSRNGTRADADEQPIDAAAFVLAFRAAYLVTGDHRYLGRMRESFAWFLGGNRLGVSVYDPATAGCRDGLGAATPNLNQGAESTVSFLLSLITMMELAGEGLEYAPAAASGPDRLSP